MPSYKELTQTVKGLEDRIKTLEVTKIDEVKPVQFQDIDNRDQLKVRVLHAGLPVFKVAPTYVGFQGETVLNDDESSTRVIYSYLNGTWFSATLT